MHVVNYMDEHTRYAKWIAEKPDIVADQRAFYQWLAREPYLPGVSEPAVADHRPTHAASGDQPPARQAELFTELQLKVVGDFVGQYVERVREKTQQWFDDKIARQRRELVKLIHDTRNIADGALRRQRGDHDKRLSTLAARIEELQTANAALELRLDTVVQKQATEAKIIDLPPMNFRSRHG